MANFYDYLAGRSKQFGVSREGPEAGTSPQDNTRSRHLVFSSVGPALRQPCSGNLFPAVDLSRTMTTTTVMEIPALEDSSVCARRQC